MCIRDRIKVRREPQRMANKESVNAKMWYSGRAAILLIWLGGPTRSSAGANQASACNTAATILRCVNTAPLERPVVPPVYCKKATESSVLGAAWNGSAAPCARACLKDVALCPSDSVNLYAGTILARWRTAKVIQRPYQKPSKSP